MTFRLAALTGAAATLALLLPQPAGAESLKDQFIRRRCEAKVNEELMAKGMASPPPMFAQKVCDCVVKKVDTGSTIEAAKDACKAEVKARIEAAAGESATPTPAPVTP